jgi:hypothetical protein
MPRLPLLIAGCTMFTFLSWSQTTAPVPVDNAAIANAPFRFNGLLWINGLTGSASMVAPGVMATAAHLLFDEDAMAWVPVGAVRYYPAYHENTDPFFSSAEYHTPVSLQRYTSYYPERVAADQNEGNSSLDTFNVDFATGYFGTSNTAPGIIEHAEMNIDAVDVDGAVGILRETREKLVVGYPAEAGQIPAGNAGLMHANAARNYKAEWQGFDDLANQRRDVGGYWWGIYKLFSATTFAGGSGGPVYARDDMGAWLFSGIVVSKDGSDTLFVRAMDDTFHELVEEALAPLGGATLSRVDNLSVASAGHTEVRLEWTDHSFGEAGYRIFRQSIGVWERIASIAPDAESYTDTTALPGQVYHYAVQAYSANGNRAPKSRPVGARTNGNNAFATGSLSQPWLQFTSRGDSGWYVDDANRLRSGKVNALGHSSLVLEILGPGTLEWQWSVSSNPNPDYGVPGRGEYQDGLYLYLNGAPAFDGGDVLFISGQKGPQAFSLPLPAGNFQIEWRYEKNAYNSAGADAGYLDSLSWTPSANPYPVYGAFQFEGTDWYGSEWLGVYYTTPEFQPWVIHLELGWLSFTGTPEGWLVGHSTLQLPLPPHRVGTFYTNPDLFPYLYQPDTRIWLYYYEGTGLWGQKAWFWNANTNQYMQTP